jgi:hypothetical protein
MEIEKNPFPTCQESDFYFTANQRAFGVLSGLHLFAANHTLQDKLQRHGMAAASASFKEIAVAAPFTVCIFHPVRVIFTVHHNRETGKMKAIALFGIPFGFLNLSDHPIIHAGNLLPNVESVLNTQTGTQE